MKTLSILALATAVSAALAGAPVAAQERFAPEQRSISPTPQLHAINPSLSLSAPTNSPLQEQMREDYATSLMGAQRELLRTTRWTRDRLLSQPDLGTIFNV